MIKFNLERLIEIEIEISKIEKFVLKFKLIDLHIRFWFFQMFSKNLSTFERIKLHLRTN